MLRTLVLTCAVLVPSLAVANVSLMPPPPKGTWVVDETRTLSDAQKAQLNALARALHDEGSGQLAVVVVDSAGGPPREVALSLFNRWGVGSAERNDGAMLFVALADRAAETILGDGVDGIQEQRESDNLMRTRIVPEFKAGRPREAVLEGANGLAEILRGVVKRRQEAALQKQRHAQLAQLLAGFQRSSTSRVVDPQGVLNPDEHSLIESTSLPHSELILVVHRPIDGFTSEQVADVLFMKWKLWNGGRWLVVLPEGKRDAGVRTPGEFDDAHAEAVAHWSAAALALTGEPSRRQDALDSAMQYLSELQEDKLARQERWMKLERAIESVTPFNALGALGGGAVALWGTREAWRRRPRTCKGCGQKRKRLDEAADDAHLDEGQLKEEKVRSIDYDIWYCETCDDALVIPWPHRLSRHKKCEKCNYRTGEESSRTLEHATYDHGGQVEVTLRCAHCTHVRISTHSTPQKTRRSSSSSGSSSSFGGGSSSGGGSSGRW
jgi:uncharacterized membrane protein YgcG